MGDPRIPRLQGELQKHLEEQLAMLASRCDAYYEGKFYEAKSAAAIVATLLYDHGNSSISLLNQLGIKDDSKFLDSRVRSNLVLHSARGAWPRTPLPYQQYREKDFYSFDEWWNNQSFNLHFSDIVVTRSELIKAIRNIEGGSHIAKDTVKKLAAVRRSRSGWLSSIKENDDGTTTMMVMVDITRQPQDEDSDFNEISDFELASVCAISEEILFSLTPEPTNRLRMQFEPYQKPFYLDSDTANKEKNKIKEFILELKDITDIEEYKVRVLGQDIVYLEKLIKKVEFTSEDAQAIEYTKITLSRLDIKI